MLFFTIGARRWVKNRIYEFAGVTSKNQLNFATFLFIQPSGFYFLVQSIEQDFYRRFTVSFFSFRTLAVTIPCAKIMQLVSLASHLRDIDACALLDSREKVVKKVGFE